MTISEIHCFSCNEVLGYATGTAPGPIYLCHSCKDDEDSREEEIE